MRSLPAAAIATGFFFAIVLVLMSFSTFKGQRTKKAWCPGKQVPLS